MCRSYTILHEAIILQFEKDSFRSKSKKIRAKEKNDKDPFHITNFRLISEETVTNEIYLRTLKPVLRPFI